MDCSLTPFARRSVNELLHWHPTTRHSDLARGLSVVLVLLRPRMDDHDSMTRTRTMSIQIWCKYQGMLYIMHFDTLGTTITLLEDVI